MGWLSKAFKKVTKVAKKVVKLHKKVVKGLFGKVKDVTKFVKKHWKTIAIVGAVALGGWALATYGFGAAGAAGGAASAGTAGSGVGATAAATAAGASTTAATGAATAAGTTAATGAAATGVASTVGAGAATTGGMLTAGAGSQAASLAVGTAGAGAGAGAASGGISMGTAIMGSAGITAGTQLLGGYMQGKGEEEAIKEEERQRKQAYQDQFVSDGEALDWNAGAEEAYAYNPATIQPGQVQVQGGMLNRGNANLDVNDSYQVKKMDELVKARGYA